MNDYSYQEWMQCGAKKKLTLKEAKRKAKKLGIRTYNCKLCGGWHLTKQGAGVTQSPIK